MRWNMDYIEERGYEEWIKARQYIDMKNCYVAISE